MFASPAASLTNEKPLRGKNHSAVPASRGTGEATPALIYA